MDNINENTFFEILKHLDYFDYFNIFQINKYFSESLKKNYIWKYKIENECNDFFNNNNLNYYDCYILYCKLQKVKNKLYMEI